MHHKNIGILYQVVKPQRKLSGADVAGFITLSGSLRLSVIGCIQNRELGHFSLTVESHGRNRSQGCGELFAAKSGGFVGYIILNGIKHTIIAVAKDNHRLEIFE